MPKTIYPIEFRRKFVQGWSSHVGTFEEYCLLFGVSRDTGYEWRARFEDHGSAGLETLSSAPRSCPHETPLVIQEFVIAARKLHPTWGPRVLKPWLEHAYPHLELPAPSTIGEILSRNGLVRPRKRRPRTEPFTKPFAKCTAPNGTWTTDFKGQFRTGDGRLCYPLTLVDTFSRYLLRCDGYLTPTEENARKSFVAAFREHGLPEVIRSDNGTPFASTAPGGLSRLSIWWIHLGIRPERITPGKPAENGRHERMHRTLKAEATEPARANLRAQQRQFNAFRREFNEDRPHQALGYTTPVSHYAASPRPYPKRLPEIHYSEQHELRLVDTGGHIKWHGHRIFISEALTREVIGLLPLSDEVTEAFFGPILLGTLSHRRPDLGLIRPDKTRVSRRLPV
jgi:putative transposase